MRRILVINPNTNPAVTQRVRAVAERHASAEVSFDVVNPSQGPFSIESQTDRQEAQGHVLALIRDSGKTSYAACVMACFDDLALEEARALLGVPVIGTCEAGIEAARAVSRRFTIVTTVHSAISGIRTLMQKYDAGSQATVRAAGIGVAEAARAQGSTQERLLQTVRDAIREDGAEAILLASGGLTGQALVIANAVGLPVIDGVEAAIRRSLYLVETEGRRLA